VSIDVGSTLGDYEVLAELGAGGVGRVYKVRHSITGRIEAIKVLLPDQAHNEEQVERFLREVKVQANLSHPNVAAVLNAFQSKEGLVMVMEFVEGQSLDKIIAQGKPSLERTLDFASQALSALQYAHESGVIHRDVKPENILITPSSLLKVTDFGLAKTAADARLTATGAALGSLYYMSPEQVNGVTTLDARTDVYSIGAVLYELAVGRRPFAGDYPFELMRAHVEQEPQPPSEIDPSLPQALSDVILKALSKRPEDRFTSAQEFLDAMESARTPQRDEAAAVSVPITTDQIEPTGRTAGRRTLAAAAVGLFAVLAVLAVRQSWAPDPTQTVAVPSGSHGLLRKLITRDAVRAISFSSDTEFAATLADDGAVEVWELSTGARRTVLEGADADSPALALSPDGGKIAFQASNGQLIIRSIEFTEDSVLGADGQASSAAFSPDGLFFAAALGDTTSVWGFTDSDQSAPIQSHSADATAVSFGSTGAFLASALREPFVLVYGPRHDERPLRLPMPGGARSVAFGSSDSLLGAVGGDGVRVWNSAGGEELNRSELPGDPLAVAITQLRRCMVLTFSGQSAQIWDATSEVEVSSFLHDHEVEAGAMTADGRLVATATSAGDLWVWKADAAWQRPAAKGRKNFLRRAAGVFGVGKKRESDEGSRDLWRPRDGPEQSAPAP